ncbi:hypothetical protein ABKN59_010254 [Abortiporus biennis]
MPFSLHIVSIIAAHLPALSSNFGLKSLVELKLSCYGLLEEHEVSLDAHNFPSLNLSRIRFNLDIFDDRRAPHHNCGFRHLVF